MKYLLALAFLAVVCAIPRPEQTSRKEGLELWEPSQGSGDGDYKVIDAKGASPSEQYETTDESDEEDDADDKDDSDLNLDSLINALSSIREAIKKIIRDKLNHNKNEKAPVNEASSNDKVIPQHAHGTESGGPISDHNNLSQNKSAVTSANDTAYDNEPEVNITLIKKEIRKKIGNIISNILCPWLGNNSVEDERVEGGEISNTVDIATEAPKPENNTESPQNDVSSNGTEIVSLSNGEVQINNTSASSSKKGVNNEISTIQPAVVRSGLITSKVSQGVNASYMVHPQSQVRFVNSYTSEIVQPQTRLQNLRNFPFAHRY